MWRCFDRPNGSAEAVARLLVMRGYFTGEPPDEIYHGYRVVIEDGLIYMSSH